jgi:hypothetical protein
VNRFIVLLAVVLSSVGLAGQTNPTPQGLPYVEDFSSCAHFVTEYPEGTQGWVVPGGMSQSYPDSSPSQDYYMNSRGYADNAVAGFYNYYYKIGFLCSNYTNFSIAFAIDTSGKENIQVSYDVMTIRNPYGYLSNDRINETILQYRVGATGIFANLPGTEYQNNTTTQTNHTTSPQNLQDRAVTLPAACNDQPIVQLRLISREVSGSGANPSFAIDNISADGDDITTPVELTNIFADNAPDNSIRLYWVSQSETGLNGYYVYRSEHNEISQSHKISDLIAATNTSQTQTYMHPDSDLTQSGEYYYWVESVELDGSSEFHGPTSCLYYPGGNSSEPPIPGIMRLENFPNPFNPSCSIKYTLAEECPVLIRIFDARGRLVRSFNPGRKSAGEHFVIWDGKNLSGKDLPSGVYLIIMKAGGSILRCKAVLLK